MTFILGVIGMVDSCPSSPNETTTKPPPPPSISDPAPATPPSSPSTTTQPSNPTPAPPKPSPTTSEPPPSTPTPAPPSPDPAPARYMLITTGVGEEKGKGKSTEVFDMKDPTKTCKNLPEYPLDVFMAAGGLINKMPVICGGNNIDPFPKIKTCYILKNNIEWTKLSSLVFSRFIENVNPGSVIVNDGKSLWITGFILINGYSFEIFTLKLFIKKTGGATLDTDPSQPDIR